LLFAIDDIAATLHYAITLLSLSTDARAIAAS